MMGRADWCEVQKPRTPVRDTGRRIATKAVFSLVPQKVFSSL